MSKLTLEHLTQMNGKPVWIVENGDNHWELCACGEDYLLDRDVTKYGVTWKAYDHEVHPDEGDVLSLLEFVKQQPKVGKITPSILKYIDAWEQMDISNSLFLLAYETTLLKRHDLKWPYLHGLLRSYHEKGFKTAQDVHNVQGNCKK